MHRTEAFIIRVSESCSEAGQPGGGGNTILVTPEGPEAAWPWVCHRDRAYTAPKGKAWGQNHHTPPCQHTEPSTWTCRKSTLFLLPRMPPKLQDSLEPTAPHGIQGFTLPRALLPLSLPQVTRHMLSAGLYPCGSVPWTVFPHMYMVHSLTSFRPLVNITFSLRPS